MVKMSNHYVAPAILQEGRLELEMPILENSLVDKAVITSVGQEVEEHNFGSDPSFNHEWE
jgi:hypothetical protein